MSQCCGEATRRVLCVHQELATRCRDKICCHGINRLGGGSKVYTGTFTARTHHLASMYGVYRRLVQTWCRQESVDYSVVKETPT